MALSKYSPLGLADAACANQAFVERNYYWSIAAPVSILLFSVLYRLLSPSLIPNRKHVMHVVLPGEIRPHPHASSLSLWSSWRCRLAWSRYARTRGTTGSDLAKSIRADYQVNWIDGDKPAHGDLISAWDRIIVWNRDCLEMAVLESMRDVSDILSDRALDAVYRNKKQNPRDVAETIAEHHVSHTSSVDATDDDEALSAFWHAADRRPPLGCGAVGMNWLRENGMISEEVEAKTGHCRVDIPFVKSRNWHPTDEGSAGNNLSYDLLTPNQKELYDAEEARVLARGKTVFHTYGPNMELGLLLVGLGGGFASGRITDVLRSTGYLMSAAKLNAREGGPAAATLGPDASESDYLLRLATYVEQAGRELVEKGIIGDEHGSNRQSISKEEQQVPTQASSDRTYKRLLETATFLLDVTESAGSLTPPSLSASAASNHMPKSGSELLAMGGKGWLSCMRVRFLHTGVRRRLLSAPGSTYPLGSGIPINQEDLVATLLAFSTAPLMALQTQGLTPSEDEVLDYIALWRHIGFYMGVEPRFLRRCFRDVFAAQSTFACISSHHFLPLAGRMDSSTPPAPSISSSFGPRMLSAQNDARKTIHGSSATIHGLYSTLHFDHGPALPLLWGVSDRPPGNMAFSTLCAIARFLLGDALANATSLPATTARQYLGLRLRLLLLAYPPLFGRYYPRKQWSVDLRQNWARLVRRLVLYASKGQVAQFISKPSNEHVHHQEKEQVTVELSAEEGKQIVREYRRLMREMIGVSLAVLFVLFISVLYCFRVSHAVFTTSLSAVC